VTNALLTAGGPDRERLARVALNLLFEPGDRRLDGLMPGMTAFDLLARLLDPDVQQELAAAQRDALPRLEDLHPDHTLERAEALGLRFVIPGDEEWPSQLDRLDGQEPIQDRTGVPVGLWVRGPLPLGALARSVAIVGSRDATSYGADAAARIAAVVAANGFIVVSGGAYGIDAAAHRGALSATDGRTVAVLACGADRYYPEQNSRLLQVVAETGAIISEVPPGLPVTRMRFLARNRLIAALARGTVVVEAAARSGALNTANWTDRLTSQLMCVPGPITAVQSLGVHELVRAGKGTLVTRGEDVLELVGRAGEYLATSPRGPQRRRDRLNATHRQVLDAVPVGQPATAVSIARTAGIHPKTVAYALTTCEKLGLVERFAGGWQLTPEAVRS
jgi:DNA processing protein